MGHEVHSLTRVFIVLQEPEQQLCFPEGRTERWVFCSESKLKLNVHPCCSSPPLGPTGETKPPKSTQPRVRLPAAVEEEDGEQRMFLEVLRLTLTTLCPRLKPV